MLLDSARPMGNANVSEGQITRDYAAYTSHNRFCTTDFIDFVKNQI